MLALSAATRARLLALHDATLRATGVVTAATVASEEQKKRERLVPYEVTAKLFRGKSNTPAQRRQKQRIEQLAKEKPYSVPSSVLEPLLVQSSKTTIAPFSPLPIFALTDDGLVDHQHQQHDEGEGEGNNDLGWMPRVPFSPATTSSSTSSIITSASSSNTTTTSNKASSSSHHHNQNNNTNNSNNTTTTTLVVCPRHVIPLGIGTRKIKGRLVRSWRSGHDNMSFKVFSTAVDQSWVSFQGLAVPVPASMSREFHDNVRLRDDVTSETTVTTTFKSQSNYWSRKLQRSFNLQHTSPSAITAEHLPCLWWFYCWLHRNHTVRFLFDAQQLRRMSSAPSSSSSSSSSSSFAAATGAYKMTLRSIRDADRNGQNSLVKDAAKRKQKSKQKQDETTISNNSNNNNSHLLPPLTSPATLRSAHGYVMWRLEKHFLSLKAMQLRMLVRHWRVFLEYVDAAAYNEKQLLASARQMSSNKQRLRHRRGENKERVAKLAEASSTFGVEGEDKEEATAAARSPLNHSAVVLPRDVYFEELQRWREWRLLYSFFPVLAVRAAVVASGVNDSSTKSSKQKAAQTQKSDGATSPTLLPFSPTVSVPATERVSSILDRICNSDILSSSSGKEDSSGKNSSNTKNQLALLEDSLRLSRLDMTQIKNRTGFWVFRSALPSLEPVKYWQHFSVSNAVATKRWNALQGPQRVVFDTKLLHRASGERRSEPFFNYLRECVAEWARQRKQQQQQDDERNQQQEQQNQEQEQDKGAASFIDFTASGTFPFPSTIGQVHGFARRRWSEMHPVEQAKYFDHAVIQSVFPDFAGFSEKDVEEIKRAEEERQRLMMFLGGEAQDASSGFYHVTTAAAASGLQLGSSTFAGDELLINKLRGSDSF